MTLPAAEPLRLKVGDQFTEGEHVLTVKAIGTNCGQVVCVGWSSTDGTHYSQTPQYVRKQITSGRWKPVEASLTVSGDKPVSEKTAAALQDVKQAAVNLLATKRKGGHKRLKVIGLVDPVKQDQVRQQRAAMPAAEVPEKYRPVFEPGAKRRYFELERKIFFDVEIVQADAKTVTHRGVGAPEHYTFETDRALFIKQLAEACYRETGDDLKAGKILEAR